MHQIGLIHKDCTKAHGTAKILEYHHADVKDTIAFDGSTNDLPMISWSRICPDDRYQVNEEGLAFYDAVFDELHKYGIKPVVTIDHFDMPMYLADHYDGWSSRELIGLFLFYAKTIFTRYKGKVLDDLQ